MDILDLIKRFLHYNDIWYFRGYAPRGFNKVRVNSVEPSPSIKDGTPKHHVKGRTFRVEENGEWVRQSKMAGALVPYLTRADYVEIEASLQGNDPNKKLNAEKYMIIKSVMVMEEIETAEQASTYLNTEYGNGYGIRTIEKYWAAIRRTLNKKATPLS